MSRPVSRLLAAALVLLGAAAAGLGQAPQGTESRGGGVVWMVDLDGPLGPASADLITRSLEDAEEAGARAFIIRMDTPGGLDKAMRSTVKRILAAEIPVVTFVAPDGARAASAGTYIAYASHIAVMAPATNIGSSTPVSIAPSPAPPTPAPAAPQEGKKDGEGEGAAPSAPSPDAMTRKVVNDAVAYLQGLAELRGRNVEWAEETVREGANIRASEALELNVIDLIAQDVPTLLAEIDGWEVALATRTVVLDTANAGVYTVETDWQHELLEIITDPTIAYGLLIFGVYGLILEFYNPGMVFPSVIGIICLLLGAYGLQMLPINYAGLLLIVVGIGMMIAEVFTPSMGVLSVAGVVSFVIGSLILMDTEAPGYEVPLTVVAAFAVSTAGLTLFTVGAAVRARRRAVTTGKEGMLGELGEVVEDFDQEGAAYHGRVRALGEVWQAESTDLLRTGARVRVSGLDGLKLIVRPEE